MYILMIVYHSGMNLSIKVLVTTLQVERQKWR